MMCWLALGISLAALALVGWTEWMRRRTRSWGEDPPSLYDPDGGRRGD
jgi:predicted negative regulator of RcsB-dependent stress response